MLAAAVAIALSGAPLLAQLTPNPIPVPNPALSALLVDAARVNARIPERLRAYRARIETEMSLIVLDSGRERTAQVEQIASDVRWRSPDRYDQRVIGYRNQSVGPTFSLMSFFGGWTAPTLYGNRLQLGVTPPPGANRASGGVSAGLAIHPLAVNRNAHYLYGGGDTSVTLVSNGRRIPIVRVRVTPRTDAPGDAILFLGDMYLDADWKQIARMRGRMVEVQDGKVTLKAGSRIAGVSGASFVELVNVEVDGAYWLPAFQRTEFQARVAMLGDFRSVVRIVSRFGDYHPNDSSWSGREGTRGMRHNLTFASSADQARFRDWERPIGAASSDVYYGELDDLAPESWGTADRARGIHFRPRAVGEILRFNRIEGLFTGVAVGTNFGVPARGLTANGSLGWAWAERTARGAVGLERIRGVTTTGVRVERALAHTNDFQLPFSWGASVSALLGSTDDFDYLDRRSASVYLGRALGSKKRGLARIEIGGASDNAVRQNISRGLYVGKGEGFRPNRGIREGNYVKTVAALEHNSQVSGLFVDRGVGARVRYERADGDLRWQRLELRTAARREVGPFQLYARADAGTLIGEPAPQAMFEIGGGEGLSAYGYKEFGGDRAALARAVAGYTFPLLRAPVRLPSNLILPGLAPGVAAGIHAGWTDVSGARAERALLELGAARDTLTGQLVGLSRPTDGIRATAEFLVTFFNGALAFGVTRPIDTRGPWKFTGRIGQGF